MTSIREFRCEICGRVTTNPIHWFVIQCGSADNRLDAAKGLALVRLTIGAMFVWVFFENLGKGLYTASGYTGLINYYIKATHAPAAWKAVLGFMAGHAAMAAPMQGLTEISL